MQNLDIDPNVFMCSFDVSSLFTNVPLDETIKICSEALYDQSNSRPVIPKDVFVELMKSATSSVEFSFNNTMYKQTDGVAMGSPLGPALANIFVGYYEEKLFSQTQKPSTYFTYVDDTFAIFDHEAEADTLSFPAGPVCSSFSAEACAILHALCWSRQHHKVCHFSSLLLLSDSRSVLAILFSPPSFLLSQTLWQIWQELSFFSSCSIRLKWVPGHSFLPGSDTADELARRGALLVPSAIPCRLSPLISRIHCRLISDCRRTVSSKYFDTQVPSISTEELVLPRHARCVLSRLRCNGHSLLLGSYLSRIGRIENSSCSACGHPSQDISHLILHCPATDSLRRSLFGDFLSLYDLWSRPWAVAQLLGLHGLPPCPHPSEGVG